MGDAKSGNLGKLMQGYVMAEIVLDEAERLSEFVVGHCAAVPVWLQRERAVAVDDPGRQRCGQAVQVESPARVSVLNFILQGPSDVFDLGVARLEAAADFQVAWIFTRIHHDTAEHLLPDPDHQVNVSAFELPGRRRIGRYDVDVSIDGGSPVRFSSMTAEGEDRRPGVNTHSDSFRSRRFHYSRRIRQQSHTKIDRCSQLK